MDGIAIDRLLQQLDDDAAAAAAAGPGLQSRITSLPLPAGFTDACIQPS